MQRLLSILVIVLLGFTELNALVHQLEAEVNCHEDTSHLCPVEDHHHCELCEEYVLTAVVQHSLEILPEVQNIPLETAQIPEQVKLQALLVFSGRAPPVLA